MCHRDQSSLVAFVCQLNNERFLGLPQLPIPTNATIKRSDWGILLKSPDFFLCATVRTPYLNCSRLPPLHREGEILRILLTPCIAPENSPIKRGKEIVGWEKYFSEMDFEFFASVRPRTSSEFRMARKVQTNSIFNSLFLDLVLISHATIRFALFVSRVPMPRAKLCMPRLQRL